MAVEGIFMTKAMIVENGDGAIGVAVEERGGFLFYAADAQYRAIDAKIFRRFKDLERAAAVIDRSAPKRR
jgi:hypothetical protein